MKKLLLALALVLWPACGWAQCTGVFPAKTLCGNLNASPQPPAAFPSAGTVAGPSSSTSGDIVTWTNSAATAIGDPASITTSQALTLTGANSEFSTNVTSLSTSQFTYQGAVLLFPAVNATIPYLAGSQTWTGTNSFAAVNATGLTSLANVQLNQVATVSPFSVGNGGTGNATATAHSIPINEGVAAQANTGAGTTGQCATSNGASADPTFASGCWTLLSTTTATSGAANITDTTHITASYNDYELSITNCAPVTTNVTLILLATTAAGVATSNYLDVNYANTGAAATQTTSTGALLITNPTNQMTNTAIGVSAVARLFAADPNNRRRWFINANYDSSGGGLLSITTGYLSPAVALTGYQLQFGAGNIASCVAKLYGRL